MIEAIVINRLIKWSKWKMGSGVSLGYKRQVNFVRLSGGRDQSLGYDDGYDADCHLTDKAVDLLPEVYKLVIRVEYIDKLRDENAKAHRYGKSRRTYREDRDRAYLLLGNLLDALLNSRTLESA